MMKPRFTFAAIASVVLLVGSARAQWAEFAETRSFHTQQMEALNAGIAQTYATERAIVANAMLDPRAQERYAAHRAQGGMLSAQDFGHYYVGSAGFSAAGVAAFNQSSSQIAQRDRAAIFGYHDYVSQLQAETDGYRAAVGDRIARHRGEALSGMSTYLDPHTGMGHWLPNTTPSNTSLYNPQTGHLYRMDGFGGYQLDEGDGWESPLFEMP